MTSKGGRRVFTAKRPARLGVLISGRGSNMIALAKACAAPEYPAKVALVLANEPQAAGLKKAASMGLKTAVVAHRAFPKDKPGFEAAITEALEAAKVDVVCLAGFMRILSTEFIERWRDRLLNIHPSLLPAFRGLDSHARALEAGVRFHGATVHLVRPAMDEGPILAQAALQVRADDDADSLSARVLRQEHRLYAHALRLWLTGALRLEDERVIEAKPGASAARAVISPPLNGNGA